MDGHHFRPHFPGQGLAGLGADRCFREDGVHLVFPAVFHQFGQLPGIGFPGGKDPFHAVLFQPEIPAQVGKGRMTGDEIFPGNGLEFFFVGFFQLPQPSDEFFPIGLVIGRIVRIRLGQPPDNGRCFHLGTGGAQPGMGIILAVFPDLLRVFIDNGGHIPGCRNLDQTGVFRRFHHIFRPGFHSQPLEHQYPGPAQILHAPGGGLEFMGFRPFRDQGGHRHLVPPNGFRDFLHGIKAGHHRQPAFRRFGRGLFPAAPGKKSQKPRQQQQYNPFHRSIPFLLPIPVMGTDLQELRAGEPAGSTDHRHNGRRPGLPPLRIRLTHSKIMPANLPIGH